MTSVVTTNNIEFGIGVNAGILRGNAFLANRFTVILLSSPTAPMAFGIGGDMVDGMIMTSSDQYTAESVAATAKSSVDQTVSAMLLDQSDLDPTEQIVSATIESVSQSGATRMVTISLVPVQLDAGATSNPVVNFPL